MTGAWPIAVAIGGGLTAGLGVFLALRQLLPAVPALGPALHRLQPGASPAAVPDGRPSGGGWALMARYVVPPRRALDLLGRGPDQYLASITASATAGLLAPNVVALVLARLGLSLPLALPLGFSLALAAGCGYLAHREVLAKAERARRDFIRAFCTYVDLVALELTASGPVQALERAAKVCQGWAFDRITEALTQAQLEMTLPWQQLRRLAVQIGVPDLHDLAATMQSAGAEGAQVQQTLREQADSLRNRLRTEALARAEAISARLEMPAAMLVIVLAIFMIFPLMARLP